MSLKDLLDFVPSLGPISDYVLKEIVANPLSAGVAFQILIIILGLKMILGIEIGLRAVQLLGIILALMVLVPMFYFLFGK